MVAGPLAVLWVIVAVALAATAHAQEDPGDPYGATTTTNPPPSATPACAIAEVELVPGETATVELVDLPPAHEVTLLLGGIEVARATSPDGPGATVAMDVSFVVPELPAGEHRLDAVGTTFTVGCGPDGVVVVLGAEVLPVEGALPRTDPVAGSDGGSTDGRSGALPRTGTSIALLLAVALALLLLGRALLGRARRRRRRHHRQPPAPARQLAPR